MRTLLSLALLSALAFAATPARAADGGDAGVDACATDDSGACAPAPVPVACDGALCDTSNDAACDLAPSGPGAPSSAPPLALGLGVLVAGFARRRRRTLPAAILCACAFGLASNAAHAEPPPPVDVVLREPAPQRRYVAIEWSPVSLIIGKLSANLVIVPAEHHGLVLSPFYASTTTVPIYVYDDAGNATVLPQQSFKGGGGELGYRYYFGRGGPRGFFLGPSLMLADFTATAANGSETQFLNYGVAADVGFQALLVDRISVSLGAGVQYNATSKTIPNQQFPADVYANAGFRPRLLASIGCAF